MPRESRSKTAAAKVAAPGADVIAPTDDPRLAKQTAVSVAKSKVGKGKQVPGAQAEESGRDKAQVASTPLALAASTASTKRPRGRPPTRKAAPGLKNPNPKTNLQATKESGNEVPGPPKKIPNKRKSNADLNVTNEGGNSELEEVPVRKKAKATSEELTTKAPKARARMHLPNFQNSDHDEAPLMPQRRMPSSKAREKAPAPREPSPSVEAVENIDVLYQDEDDGEDDEQSQLPEVYEGEDGMDSGEQSQLPEDYEGEDGMDSAPKHTGHEDDPTERQLQLETPRWASNKPENASGSRFRPRPQESGSESSDSQPSKPPTQMTTKNRRQGSAKQVPKSSKRAVATAKSETPSWEMLVNDADEDIKPTLVGGSGRSSPNDSDGIEVVINPWSERTHLVYTADSQKGAPIGTSLQNEDVNTVIHLGLNIYYGKVFSENAFPSGNLKTRLERDAVCEAAIELNFKDFIARITQDRNYVDRLSSPLDGRLSLFRSKMKTTVTAAIQGYFSLDTSAKIDAALLDDVYIYRRKKVIQVLEARPGMAQTEVEVEIIDKRHPYRHELLQNVLKATFFTPRKSVADTNPTMFTSSLPNDPVSKHQLELPRPMIALVATAMYASILHWGKATQPVFSANIYYDVYLRHILSLEDIKVDNPTGYHAITASLYNHCVGANAGASARSNLVPINTASLATELD